MDHTGVPDLLAALAARPLFVTELRARLGDPSGFDDALAALDGGRVLVVDHTAPDPHLDGDLRVAALAAPGAPAAVGRVWHAWVRDVLAAHRCC